MRHPYEESCITLIILRLLQYFIVRSSQQLGLRLYISKKDLPGPKVFLLFIYYVESLNSSFICNPSLGR